MIAFLEIVDRTDVRVPQRPEDQDFMTKRGYLPRVAAKFVRKDLDRQGDAEFSVVDLENLGSTTFANQGPIVVALRSKL